MTVQNAICLHCGLQYAKASPPANGCLNCEDDRESITHQPQAWTTLAELLGRHRNNIVSVDRNVFGIATAPSFAIGQEIFLLQTPFGNVLWDCLAYIDDR